MKRSHLIAALLSALLLLCAAPALAQLEALEFDSDKVPVGRVFHFVKSQRDGTHATRISVYVPEIDRIESLKWDAGGDTATLVVARMDWPRFSVKQFEGWRLARGQAPERRVTLDVTGDQLAMSLMSEPLRISHWPWHSYDFDFTSLNLTLPHLSKPERGLSIWRTDFVYADPPTVAELGAVELKFVKVERRDGRRLRRYSIGGPGLENQDGTWWSDARSGLLVEYELPVGDEPGYDDVRLKLDSTEKADSAQWDAFKRKAVGD